MPFVNFQLRSRTGECQRCRMDFMARGLPLDLQIARWGPGVRRGEPSHNQTLRLATGPESRSLFAPIPSLPVGTGKEPLHPNSSRDHHLASFRRSFRASASTSRSAPPRLRRASTGTRTRPTGSRFTTIRPPSTRVAQRGRTSLSASLSARSASSPSCTRRAGTSATCRRRTG